MHPSRISSEPALPRFQRLELVYPCSNNTYRTTVSCLLALSVNCEDLFKLRIHLNTANFIDDIRSLPEDPNFRGLRSLPTRCPLVDFYVARLSFPPNPSDKDIATIATGLIGIFPSLCDIHSLLCRGWLLVQSRAREFHESATSSASAT